MSPAVRPTERHRDDGAVLPMVLVLMVVGSLVMVALLAFASTLIRTRPPLEARSDSLEAVRSAMRLAAVAQTNHGTDGCFPHDDGDFDINGRQVRIFCNVVPGSQTNEEGSRFSMITTDNRVGLTSNGGAVDMVGKSFFSGGNLATTVASMTGSSLVNATGFASQPPTNRPAGNYRYTTVAETEIPLASNDCAPLYGGAIREFDYTGPLYSADNPPRVVVLDDGFFGFPVLTLDLVTLDLDLVTPGVQDTVTVVGEGEWVFDGVSTATFTAEPGFLGDPSPIDFEVTLLTLVTFTGQIAAEPLNRDEPAFVTVLPDDDFSVTPDPTDNARVFGVFLSDETGGWVLHRPTDPAAPFTFTPTVTTTSDVRICYQELPPSDPASIPFDTTFCASPLVDNPAGIECSFDPWWTSAGRQPALGAPYQYPFLPELPSEMRVANILQDVKPGCQLLYPGRYPNPVVLSGNTNFYLASGTYLFENKLSITGGARVIAGDGTRLGCADDADGSFPTDGSNPAIDPSSGVTILLGGDGMVEVDGATFIVNERRYKTEEAPIGISVMSVNLKTPVDDDVVDVEIPYTDRVLRDTCRTTPRADASLECDVSTYTSGGEMYPPSTKGADQPIIEIRNAVEVEFAGAVFTPNAKIVVDGNLDPTESVFFALGATASRVEIDVDRPDGVTFGRLSEVEYQKVRLIGRHTFESSRNGNTQTVASWMIIELDKNDRYAINSWTIETK